ncbi:MULTISPECIES: hypothetical protein [Methanobrevibacter]|uniref:hypothetical protein n=1 Tax=Methanobrevibacter TaxID=2172 RepID=UPI000B996395|nr:hypothetical protein [Methanobrevibacter smithii]
MFTLEEEYGEQKYNEGFEKGFKEGIKESSFEIAEELIKKEMDLYDVSYVTNIGMATLGELKESMKNNKSSKLSAKNE